MDLKRNLDEVILNVEKARLSLSPHHIVKIVAVSKYTDASNIASLYNIGQRAFGESKVQDLVAKNEKLSHLPIEWHFIGRLQKNKINHLLALKPTLIHSIDSFELASEIDKRAALLGYIPKILLQINSAKEESKAGVMPECAIDVYNKIEESCRHLKICGVMTIGAHSEDEEIIKKSFDTTKNIFDTIGGSARILSMGMSSDYELAIKCGSNLIRIGSNLFK